MGLCVAISNSFTEILEGFEFSSVNDTMKTSVHNQGVIAACRPDSEECQEF